MNGPVPRGTRMHGFGLVELMIAMTLGLLLAGVYEMFLTNKVTYNTQEALSRLQENTRYVVHTLSYDLRMAGYAGCRPASAMQINVMAKGLPATAFTSHSFVSIDGKTTVTVATPSPFAERARRTPTWRIK